LHFHTTRSHTPNPTCTLDLPTRSMPRGRRKSSKGEIAQLYRKCRYCKAHRNAHFFNRHEAACKIQYIIRNEDRQLHSCATSSTLAIENMGDPVGIDGVDFMEASSTMPLENTLVPVGGADSDQPQAAGANEPNSSE